MIYLSSRHLSMMVALLTEGVDRNDGGYHRLGFDRQVALLTEGVDRNTV